MERRYAAETQTLLTDLDRPPPSSPGPALPPPTSVKPFVLCGYLPGEGDLGCEFNGVTYQEGQTFQPSCHTLCRCSGGGVTCVPACPLDARRPTPDCPNPQHIRIPGECCKQWVCENLENTVIQDAITGWPIFQLSPAHRCHTHLYVTCWMLWRQHGFLVYVRFVLRGRVWKVSQGRFHASDRGVSDRGNVESENNWCLSGKVQTFFSSSSLQSLNSYFYDGADSFRP